MLHEARDFCEEPQPVLFLTFSVCAGGVKSPKMGPSLHQLSATTKIRAQLKTLFCTSHPIWGVTTSSILLATDGLHVRTLEKQVASKHGGSSVTLTFSKRSGHVRDFAPGPTPTRLPWPLWPLLYRYPSVAFE